MIGKKTKGYNRLIVLKPREIPEGGVYGYIRVSLREKELPPVLGTQYFFSCVN